MYGFMILGAYTFQRNLIYIPFGGRPSIPTKINGNEFEVRASDNTITTGWHIKPVNYDSTPRDQRINIVIFHGNAGHRGHRLGWANELRQRLKASVVITDPRGYGGNEGSPSEQGLYMDGLACVEWVKENHGGKIILLAKICSRIQK